LDIQIYQQLRYLQRADLLDLYRRSTKIRNSKVKIQKQHTQF